MVAGRRPHAVGLAEATWVVGVLHRRRGHLRTGSVVAGRVHHRRGVFAGWVVEKSLSVDNLFVLVIIMGRSAVPAQYQQKVLLFGIMAALGICTATPGKLMSQQRSPARFRVATASSPALPATQSLTHYGTGNKLVGAESDAASRWRQAVPATEPSQEPGNGGTGRQAGGSVGSRPARQYRPGRGRHAENTIMSALVRAGLVPRSYLLTTQGRKTGRPRTNPVVPVEHDGRRWLVAPYGPVSWVHNARAAGRVTLTRRRDTRQYAIREAAPEQAGPILKRYVRIATATRRYFLATKDSPVEDFVTEAGRHPVFELTPLDENRKTSQPAP